MIAQLSQNKDLDVGAALKQLVSTQTSINAKAAEDAVPSPPSVCALRLVCHDDVMMMTCADHSAAC